MLTLQDGPAKGTFLCKHAPEFLRAVVDEITGEADCLDAPSDEPKRSEKVHVYQRLEYRGVVHLNSRKAHGFYALATYKHLPEVNGEVLRNNTDWWKFTAKLVERKEVITNEEVS